MYFPLVSVIVRTCFDRRGCLQEAIESIFKQTYSNIELVIVENGSEGLEAWLDPLGKPSGFTVRHFHLPKADRCAAGNYGLDLAEGELLCFLDDDDQFYPSHIETLVAAIDENEGVSAAYSVAHELPSYIVSYTPFECHEGKKIVKFHKEFSRGALFVDNYIPIQSVLFKKTLFYEHGGFDLELQALEDWNLWVRYVSNSDFVFVNKVTSFYRVPMGNGVVSVRNDFHAAYYCQARFKQGCINTPLSIGLLKEIVVELIPRGMASCSTFCEFLEGKVKDSKSYTLFCNRYGVDLSVEPVLFNVLGIIELAKSIKADLLTKSFIVRASNFLLVCVNRVMRKFRCFLT